MAVFTEVTPDEAQRLLSELHLGQLSELRGIEGGIENTNYFATTSAGPWVMTLFERLSFEQLPFYLYLMKHLARHGIPVPDPAANDQGEILHRVCGKPAAVVSRLRGKSQLAPTPVHCAAVGAMLARMHLAGRDFNRSAGATTCSTSADYAAGGNCAASVVIGVEGDSVNANSKFSAVLCFPAQKGV